MPDQSRTIFESMSREELLRALEMSAKNWLAHDGSWFLAVEEQLGTQTAIDLDARSWERFAAAEARRIMATFRIPAGSGLLALEKALNLRLYSVINPQHVEWSDDGRRLRFFMDICRVQETRRLHGLLALSSRCVRGEVLRLGVHHQSSRSFSSGLMYRHSP